MYKQLGRLRWYFFRLAAMSPAEIGHRVEEQLKRLFFRVHTPAFPHIDGPLPVIPGLRERLLALPDDSLPLAAWAESFESAKQGRYSVLGQDWPVDLDPCERWHVDPVTEKYWPADSYCYSIRFRDGNDLGGANLGDIKFVWEFNRLQHLQPIAAYAARTGDIEAATYCIDAIDTWIDANPPFFGVNWCSRIELALRIVSIIVVTSLLGPEVFDHDKRGKLLACLSAHGYWISQFPSRFSSANNHLVAEAAGLYLLGALAPDLAGASRWRRYGRKTLEEELEKQVYPDGVGTEQSPSYTSFSLEWWLLAHIVGDAVGVPFSQSYTERLGAAGTFLRWILDENDNYPRYGDDDEGRVVFSPQGNDAYVPTVLQTIAGITATPDIGPHKDYPHLWRALHAALPDRTAAPLHGLRTFADGGYTVVREPSSYGELLLMFDHGPLGYLSIAAHGHADALALWLHLDGQPVLVDAGTFLYFSGEEWRNHFRSTVAHNTLTVENEDSSRIVGPFNWSHKAEAKLIEATQEGTGWRLEAEHNGYQSAHGVRHRRSVTKGDGETFEVTDMLVGSGGSRRVEAGFLVSPDLSVTATGDNAFAIADGTRTLLAISSQGPLTGTIERGELSPPRGWYSPCFGDRQPTNRIVFRGELQPDLPSRLVVTLGSA